MLAHCSSIRWEFYSPDMSSTRTVEVLTPVCMTMFFWVVTPCRLVGRYQRFGEHTLSIFRAVVGKRLITNQLYNGEVRHYYRQLLASFTRFKTVKVKQNERQIIHKVINKNNRQIVFRAHRLPTLRLSNASVSRWKTPYTLAIVTNLWFDVCG
jgi:hypothetical protein